MAVSDVELGHDFPGFSANLLVQAVAWMSINAQQEDWGGVGIPVRLRLSTWTVSLLSVCGSSAAHSTEGQGTAAPWEWSESVFLLSLSGTRVYV